MFENPGFSAVSPTVVESVRNRMRAPLGCWARFHTAGRNWLFSRIGKRRKTGASSANHGRPCTASRSSGKAIRRRSADASPAAAARVSPRQRSASAHRNVQLPGVLEDVKTNRGPQPSRQEQEIEDWQFIRSVSIRRSRAHQGGPTRTSRNIQLVGGSRSRVEHREFLRPSDAAHSPTPARPHRVPMQ